MTPFLSLHYLCRSQQAHIQGCLSHTQTCRQRQLPSFPGGSLCMRRNGGAVAAARASKPGGRINDDGEREPSPAPDLGPGPVFRVAPAAVQRPLSKGASLARPARGQGRGEPPNKHKPFRRRWNALQASRESLLTGEGGGDGLTADRVAPRPAPLGAAEPFCGAEVPSGESCVCHVAQTLRLRQRTAPRLSQTAEDVHPGLPPLAQPLPRSRRPAAGRHRRFAASSPVGAVHTAPDSCPGCTRL